MVYNAGIPAPTDMISNSQAQLLENFAQLNTQFGTDHVAFNAASNNGNHKKVLLPVPLAVDPAVSGTQGAFYSKDVAGVAQLFFANAATAAKQLTGPIVAASSGSTFLPGGIILKWGSTGIVANGATVTFVSAFPTACFAVQLTIEELGVPSSRIVVQTGSLLPSSFKVNVSSGATTARYLAIGN